MKDRGILLVLVAALIWSTGGVAIKYVELDGLTIAAFRALIAGLVFLPFSKFSRFRFSWKFVGFLVSYCLMNAAFVMATKWTSAANAIAL
jgi:drug/metabolite transporter, DME family